MPKAHNPRHGSMGVWPRKRANREYTRVRHWQTTKEAKLLGFAGYKVGMTHIIVTDNRKTSKTKGEDLRYPVTIIECPPIKVVGVRFYNKGLFGLKAAAQVMAKGDKFLAKRLNLPKKDDAAALEKHKPEDYKDIRVLVQTQPNMIGIGKKKPEIFEVGIGGSTEEKYHWAKENLGKELAVKDVLAEGMQIDIRGVTTGKGFQGPVKRFGVGIRGRKTQKVKRGPGSLGGWKGQAHFMYRIAHAGQMGYHNRVDFNKIIFKIGDKPEEVNPKGGFIRYGDVKNDFILVKGSVLGPSKRMVRLNLPIRPNKKLDHPTPDITFINTESRQGR